MSNAIEAPAASSGTQVMGKSPASQRQHKAAAVAKAKRKRKAKAPPVSGGVYAPGGMIGP